MLPGKNPKMKTLLEDWRVWLVLRVCVAVKVSDAERVCEVMKQKRKKVRRNLMMFAAESKRERIVRVDGDEYDDVFVVYRW